MGLAEPSTERAAYLIGICPKPLDHGFLKRST